MTAPPFGKACQALRSSIFLVARSQLCRTRPSTRTSAGGRSSWKKLPGLRQDRVSQGLGAPNAAVETAIATEAWPICTTMDAVAENADWAQLDADFAAGKTALGAGDWSGAIAARNADIQNYIGYAYRRLRQLEPAFAHYRQALALNPRHRSAHEHLGEAYVATGDLAKAEEQLASLDNICLLPCAEYADLQTAIAAYRKTAAP